MDLMIYTDKCKDAYIGLTAIWIKNGLKRAKKVHLNLRCR